MPFLVPGSEPRASLGRRAFGGLLVGSLAAAVTGCGSGAAPAASAATREVQHPLGSSKIPVAPLRVVSMDASGGLQVSLEVGAPLVASETLDGAVTVPPYLPKPGSDFKSMGFNQPNLEQLAKLGPDLIIGNLQRVEELYPKLSEIAPTVPYENAGKGVEWRESVRLIADLLGQGGKQDAALAQYKQAAADLGKKHAAVLGKTKIVLLRFTTEELRILRGQIFGSTILDHVGVKRTPSTASKGGKDTYYPVDREHIELLADADLILSFSGGGGFAKGTDETYRSYTESLLWKRLPAVKAGRVHQLDALAWWDGYSVTAARRCLEQLDAALD